MSQVNWVGFSTFCLVIQRLPDGPSEQSQTSISEAEKPVPSPHPSSLAFLPPWPAKCPQLPIPPLTLSWCRRVMSAHQSESGTVMLLPRAQGRVCVFSPLTLAQLPSWDHFSSGCEERSLHKYTIPVSTTPAPRPPPPTKNLDFTRPLFSRETSRWGVLQSVLDHPALSQPPPSWALLSLPDPPVCLRSFRVP